MIFAIVSFIVSAACAVFYLSRRKKAEKPARYSKADATAFSVRASYFLCLCAVPFLGLISMFFNSVKWAYYAESAVVVEGAAALLIGLMALLQRYGSMFFKMEPAMEKNEILVLVFAPLIMYLSYLPSSLIILYCLGPGMYSLYLLWKIHYRKQVIRHNS